MHQESPLKGKSSLEQCNGVNTVGPNVSPSFHGPFRCLWGEPGIETEEDGATLPPLQRKENGSRSPHSVSMTFAPSAPCHFKHPLPMVSALKVFFFTCP